LRQLRTPAFAGIFRQNACGLMVNSNPFVDSECAVNLLFFPTLCAATFANLVVNACDQGRTGTLPSNAVGQMVLAATAASTASIVVGTLVVNTILNSAYETLPAEFRVVRLDDVGSQRD
jgi:cytosine/uracil/thiamine/allantoin permease